MIELLVEKGADLYSLTDENYSVIHIAVENNAIYSLAYFYYSLKFDFEMRNVFMMTPYLHAVNLE